MCAGNGAILRRRVGWYIHMKTASQAQDERIRTVLDKHLARYGLTKWVNRQPPELRFAMAAAIEEICDDRRNAMDEVQATAERGD